MLIKERKSPLAALLEKTTAEDVPHFCAASDQYVVFQPGRALTAYEYGRCVRNAVIDWENNWKREGQNELDLTPNDLVTLGLSFIRAVDLNGGDQ
jgi:hypothetical protein